MDKITRQVRIEHWTQIMNECLNSGMNKTEWCRANGISDKQFFYWQRILHSGVRYSKEDIKRRKVERKFDKRSIKKNWRLQTPVKKQ